MKIRQCFVSNSSTSSYCIFGVWVDNLAEMEKFFGPLELADATTEEDDEDWGDGEMEKYEAYDKMLREKEGLSIEYNPYDDYDCGCFVGIGVDGMDFNEFVEKCKPLCSRIEELTGRKPAICSGYTEG